jgi:tetratricopeptide (TPR) repeat protein
MLEPDQKERRLTQAALSPADIDDILGRARDLLQKTQFAQAALLCQQVLAADPTHMDGLYTLGVIQRYQGDITKALATHDRMLALDPGFGRAYQERGHCLRDTGDRHGALSAYRDAVANNAALVASWHMLSELQRAVGSRAAADFAHDQYTYLSSLPPELLTVANLIQEGRYLRAENLCRHFLQTKGHNVEAMRFLAEIGTKFNSFEEAEFLLESALVLEPNNTSAHVDYIDVLHKRQKFAKALEQATVLRARAPDVPQVDLLYANENLAVGNFDEALKVYHGLARQTPNNPTIHLTLGHALKTIGQQAEAIEAYSRAYQIRPEFGDAYWSLANLKTYRFAEGQIDAMRSHEAAATTALVDRYHLCFALGKGLEDRGDFAEAFAYYERGNRLKREDLGYDWRKISAEIALQVEHCTPALFAAKAGSGSQAPDPIFIVGLPRAGSTLLEQILASHSQVEGTMELPNILALAHRLDGRRRKGEEALYPGNLNSLTSAELTAFGEAFLRDTAIHRKTGTPFFIDKMPNNFRHIGLIHMILPKAKIIDARRNPMACCFSGFKQLFAEGQEFTYGLEEVGHYYTDYVALMDHWDRVLPGKVLRVQYEDVVADLEPQVRRLLDYCGLPFEEACINFHENDRAVRTASSEQVRQPIFKSGLDQWENFSPYLDPLRQVLGLELASRQ